MDNLVIFGLIVLTIIRFFGFLISLDFFLHLRDNRYIYLMSGWIFWVLASIFPLIADITIDPFLVDIFLLFNSISVTLGAFLVIIGVTNVFRTYEMKQILIFLALLVILSMLSFITGGNQLVGIVSSIILFIAYFTVMILDSIGGKDFKKKLGNSYKWIIIFRIAVTFSITIIFYTLLTSGDYGLYNSSDSFLITINYGIGAILTLTLVILIIHFEHSIISYQKNYLKDTLTHDIGNILQIISSATEMLSVPDKSREKTDLILKKSNEASKLINEIKDL